MGARALGGSREGYAYIIVEGSAEGWELITIDCRLRVKISLGEHTDSGTKEHTA